jgi:signal transduction histidine kinase
VRSAEDEQRLVEQVLEHVAEIGAGRCSITDAQIAAESEPSSQEILAGLLMLHEDLEYGRRREAALLDELRGAVRVRDEFLSVASHELRTPITTLGLQVDGLPRALEKEKGGPPSENVARRLALIRRQVDRLAALVTSLVDVARISSGKLELSKERADLVEIVRSVAERFGDDVRRSGSSLLFEGPAPIWGNYDVSRVDQVVTNLVSNAIRYGRGKPIAIGVASEGDRARFWVEDRGIGIPLEHQARIFQQFERVAPSTSYAGLGLGLWISRQLVEAMDGTIAVRSDVNAGSTFTVTLPRGT